MGLRVELRCSQLKALYKYIQNDYLIIDSGRRSGKTTTMIGVIDYWLKHQANDGETCIIIGRSLRHVDELLNKLCEDLTGYSIEYSPYYSIRIHYGNKTLNIVTCKSLNQYYYNISNYVYKGITITLIVGDECYIPHDWCRYTACCYTSYKEITRLNYPIEMKDELDEIKLELGKVQFECAFGNDISFEN